MLEKPMYAVAFLLQGKVDHLGAGPFVSYLEAEDARREMASGAGSFAEDYVVVETKPIAWEWK